MRLLTKKPKITVMMPALNVEKYIGESIESVLRQDWTDFELIILDDCSTDKTYDVARRYLADARVRLFRNRRKKRDADNRNLILRLARGKYIAPHDADDIMLQGRLKKQVEFLESHPAVGVVFGITVVADRAITKCLFMIQPFRANGAYRFRSGPVRKLQNDFSHCASMATKKTLIKAGLYESSLLVGTDSRLYRRLLKQTRFYYLNHLCFIYRLYPKSFFASYFIKRSFGMRVYFRSGSKKGILKSRVYVDRFSVHLGKMSPTMRDTLAWRLNYYCEKMSWNKKRERVRRLILPQITNTCANHLSDAEKYREGFLKPMSAALIKKNEFLMEASLISSKGDGILLFGPRSGSNGEWILPFIQEDYYFHSAGGSILYKSWDGIMARGLLDPLIFSEPPRKADGSIDNRLFWNPLRKVVANPPTLF